MMKKILTLCIGLLFLVACEKDPDSVPHEIVVEQSKYTLDNQGKASVSCQVTPADFDISTLQMGYSEVHQTTDDGDWSGVDIISVTKDAKTPGKWTVVIGLTGIGGVKPYAPKPGHSYTMDATVDFFVLQTNDYPVHTNKFQFSLDIKSSL